MYILKATDLRTKETDTMTINVGWWATRTWYMPRIERDLREKTLNHYYLEIIDNDTAEVMFEVANGLILYESDLSFEILNAMEI